MQSFTNFTYFKTAAYSLEASFYPAKNQVKNKTIIYFHGGGLIWGNRFDLPDSYIQQFLEAGYHFLTVDYPLAPECTLPEIYHAIQQSILWFSQEAASTLGIHSTQYFLFGRSAGAYLAFLCGKDKSLPTPQKIISFYGYPRINESFYLQPSSYYLKFPRFAKELVQAMKQPIPIVNGTLETRYGIYIYARQAGAWLDLLLPDKTTMQDYSLTDTDLAQLPPTFIAQSNQDQDIPYQVGLQLQQLIPQNKFAMVTGLPHDFDKNTEDQQAKKVYLELIDWLDK
ncbi:alpha/beta hydrolase [Isobaculum melis]|uniref:Acetyl esterase/lipase n=1 Tax=Isobaculum melis TaxID=142588 RepID=A0A1H9PU15_9LACT|nr:alpha/beta hydrolase [Isobaculum melis]SER51701.1 Acetyl esterase/lipase [Isobaculum melis]